MESYFSLSELRNTGKTLRSVNRFTLTVSLHPHLVNPLLSFSYSEGTIGGVSCDFLLRVLSERYVTLSQTVMPTNWTRRTPSPLESSVKHFFKFLFFSHFPISPSGEWVSVKCNNRTLIHILFDQFLPFLWANLALHEIPFRVNFRFPPCIIIFSHFY